jgi:hypothetical protein
MFRTLYKIVSKHPQHQTTKTPPSYWVPTFSQFNEHSIFEYYKKKLCKCIMTFKNWSPIAPTLNNKKPPYPSHMSMIYNHFYFWFVFTKPHVGKHCKTMRWVIFIHALSIFTPINEHKKYILTFFFKKLNNPSISY